MTWGMSWYHWKMYYHKWVLLPKWPSVLHDMVTCYPKIIITWVSAKWSSTGGLDALLHPSYSDFRGGGDQPLPSHAWTSLWIADMFQELLWRMNYRNCGPRDNLFFRQWLLKEGPPLWCKGYWILLGQPSYLDWERGSNGNHDEQCKGRLLSHSKCHNGNWN